MADIPQLSPPLTVRRRDAREQVTNRLLLCLVMAAFEGLVAALVVLATAIAYHTFVLQLPFEAYGPLSYAAYSVLVGCVYAAASAYAGARFLDGDSSLRATVQDAFLGWTVAFGTMLLVAFLIGEVGDLSRASLTSAYVLGVPVIIAARHNAQALIADRIRRGTLHFEKVSVIGDRVDVVNFLLGSDLWRKGHKLSAALYLEDTRGEDGEVRPEAIEEFARQSLRQGADYIVLVGSLDDMGGVGRMLAQTKRFALNIVYAPARLDPALKFLDVVSIGPNNALRFVRKPLSDLAVFAKRTTDVVLSLFGLITLSPLLAAVALAILVESRGPVIYRQARRGFNGETFMIWKYRSMRVTESGFAMQQARRHDPRITRIGRLIRATSIDELPQLVNVLLGQMSIVGPRPHAVSHDEELSQQMANYAHRQRIKPGITGWAQVNGYRGETTTIEAIEGRVRHDIYYIENWSLLLDLWIMVLTVVSPAARRNAR